MGFVARRRGPGQTSRPSSGASCRRLRFPRVSAVTPTCPDSLHVHLISIAPSSIAHDSPPLLLSQPPWSPFYCLSVALRQRQTERSLNAIWRQNQNCFQIFLKYIKYKLFCSMRYKLLVSFINSGKQWVWYIRTFAKFIKLSFRETGTRILKVLNIGKTENNF